MQSLPYLSFRWHHWKTKKPQSHKSETACENIGPWAPWKHTSIIQQFLKSGISKPSRLHCREFLEFQEGNLSLHCTHQEKKEGAIDHLQSQDGMHYSAPLTHHLQHDRQLDYYSRDLPFVSHFNVHWGEMAERFVRNHPDPNANCIYTQQQQENWIKMTQTLLHCKKVQTKFAL